ncbi:carbohydrate kinase family protein [Pseudonocardia lacus]|uniref:carbohydrate kinase family protein n=1 Tax=Pseudonocardia lacus TaxID=2835865 RepID=UPI001BDDA1DD|nr:carbohydrate kinase family protein [Pseudonocardia lacus]
MHFPGKFADLMVADQLDRMSLSFLVDDLVIRRGGSGANIAFGLGVLGQSPLLVDAVGPDFAEYRGWLEDHGVDCSAVLVCDDVHTARFVCTTDDDMRQIASFYTGAMARSREISLAPLVPRGLDLVLIGASDPEGMLRHTAECRELGIPFAADVSQQVARMEGADLRLLVEGARYLMTNDYEWELLQKKTGWTEEQVAERVDVRITTLGEHGATIIGREVGEITVGVVPETAKVDPTGVGDGFRAGFLTGIAEGLPLERAAQLGSLIAVQVLEVEGPQEWPWDRAHGLQRLSDAFGPDAAAEVGKALPGA